MDTLTFTRVKNCIFNLVFHRRTIDSILHYFPLSKIKGGRRAHQKLIIVLIRNLFFSHCICSVHIFAFLIVCSRQCFSSRSVVLVNHFSQTFFGPFIFGTPIAIHSKRHKKSMCRNIRPERCRERVENGVQYYILRSSQRTKSVE